MTEDVAVALPARRKLLLDAYYLGSSRGMGRYVRELLDAVLLIPELDVHIVVPRDHPDPLPSGAQVHWMPAVPFPLWEQFVLPVVLLRTRPDIFHAPYNSVPSLRFGAKTTVVTIHDLMFFDSNFQIQGFRQWVGRAYRRAFVPLRARPGIVVTTETNEVRGLLRERYGLAVHLHRIAVEGFVGVPPVEVEGLPERYILFVSGASYNKNSERTISAFRQAALQGAVLVVAGIRSDHSIALKHADQAVLFPGWLSDAQLVYLYDNAAAVLFPSLVEGYGLPVLEGMATCGVVITSNRPPMSELGGDGALLVDPESVDDIACAIERIWTDEGLRADLKQKAAVQMTAFSREVMARALRDLYFPGYTPPLDPQEKN